MCTCIDGHLLFILLKSEKLRSHVVHAKHFGLRSEQFEMLEVRGKKLRTSVFRFIQKHSVHDLNGRTIRVHK